MSRKYHQWRNENDQSSFLLTPGQWDVIRLAIEDCTQEEIAAELGISVSAVNSRLQRVRMRLNVRTTGQALLKLQKAGLLPDRNGHTHDFKR